MTTPLNIDVKLLEEAMKIGQEHTKTAVVNKALQEYIQRRKQLKFLDLFGTIDFGPDHDYKKARWRRA